VDIIQRIVDQVRCFLSEGRSGNTGLTYLAVQKALSPISFMCHVQCHLYVWIYTHVIPPWPDAYGEGYGPDLAWQPGYSRTSTTGASYGYRRTYAESTTASTWAAPGP